MNAPLRFELPPEALDVLVEEVVARVLERLERTRSGSSPWLTLAQAADYLALPRGRLYKLTAAKAIPCRRVGSRILLRRDELDAWLDADG